MKAPRNILLITTDQQRYDALGCNGNPHIRTPNLDRLAAEGVRFTQQTCSFPMCTPARCSLLTGQYPRTHGAWSVGVTAPASMRGLSHWLADAGFATGLFGKAHFEGELNHHVEHLGDDEPYYGFTHHAITEDRADGKYTRWLQSEHPQHLRSARNDTHEAMRPDPWPPCPQKDGLHEAYVSDTPEPLRQTTWITDRTIDFMADRHRESRPFFAWCSYVSPHHPWNPPREFAELYDPSTLPLPDRSPGAHGIRQNNYSYRPSMSDAEVRRMTALYWAMVSHIDHHVGRMLNWMAEQNLLDDTLVIFTTDHGDYNGQHGMIRKGDAMYDSLLRIPLLVRLPAAHSAGRVHEGPTQLEDIAPTIMELLGLDVPKGVQGIPFANVLRDGSPGRRRESWFEYLLSWGYETRHADGATSPQIAGVARDGWKLIQYPDERGRVLTHTAHDPGERHNLAGRPEYSQQESDLATALLAWLLATPAHRLPKTHEW